MDQQIERIIDKLKARGLALAPFTEEQVATFELEHKVNLPQEYRIFLLKIGRTFPQDQSSDVELAGLGETYQPSTIHGQKIIKKAQHLNKPFPFTSAWIWEDEPHIDPNDHRFETINYGHLLVDDYGCGEEVHLIVSGLDKGKMWLFSDIGIAPITPKVDFLNWYEKEFTRADLQVKQLKTDKPKRDLRSYLLYGFLLFCFLLGILIAYLKN